MIISIISRTTGRLLGAIAGLKLRSLLCVRRHAVWKVQKNFLVHQFHVVQSNFFCTRTNFDYNFRLFNKNFKFQILWLFNKSLKFEISWLFNKNEKHLRELELNNVKMIWKSTVSITQDIKSLQLEKNECHEKIRKNEKKKLKKFDANFRRSIWIQSQRMTVAAPIGSANGCTHFQHEILPFDKFLFVIKNWAFSTAAEISGHIFGIFSLRMLQRRYGDHLAFGQWIIQWTTFAPQNSDSGGI